MSDGDTVDGLENRAPTGSSPVTTEGTAHLDGVRGSAVGGPRRKRASPRWVGGLMLAVLYFGSSLLLVYTLLDVPFVEWFGAWNYVIVLGCVVLLSALGFTWQGDRPDPDETPYGTPARRSSRTGSRSTAT